jgi:hypothetical protein
MNPTKNAQTTAAFFDPLMRMAVDISGGSNRHVIGCPAYDGERWQR